MSSAVENENRLRKPQGRKEIGFGQSHKFMHGTLPRTLLYLCRNAIRFIVVNGTIPALCGISAIPTCHAVNPKVARRALG